MNSQKGGNIAIKWHLESILISRWTIYAGNIIIRIVIKHKWEQSNFCALLPFVSDNLAYYFLSQAFFSHPASSLQHALVESQAAESDLQQGAAASTVSTSTDSADTSELAGLLPQEVTAKENATATAAKNNLVFIL